MVRTICAAVVGLLGLMGGAVEAQCFSRGAVFIDRPIIRREIVREVVIKKVIQPVAVINGQFVSIDYAVPVGIPVAPFAPYWYEGGAARDSRTYGNGSRSEYLRNGHQRRPAADDELTDGAEILSVRCAGCHTGKPGSKTKWSFADPDAVPSWTAAKRTEILARVLSDDPAQRMPKRGEPLSDGEVRALMMFLMGDTGEAEAPAQRPAATPPPPEVKRPEANGNGY